MAHAVPKMFLYGEGYAHIYKWGRKYIQLLLSIYSPGRRSILLRGTRQENTFQQHHLTTSKLIFIKLTINIQNVINRIRAGEPDNFFAAPATDFLPKRLRLRLQRAKNMRLLAAPAPKNY